MPNAAEQPPNPTTSAQPGVTVDPFRAYNFKLLFIPGITEAHFTQVSGLGVRVDPIAYREGGNLSQVRYLPGRVDYAPVTLRYGLTQSRELWDWVQTGVKGAVQRKTVSILLLDADGATEKVRWTLRNAWPSGWNGAPLDAMSSLVAIESLELVYETLDLG